MKITYKSIQSFIQKTKKVLNTQPKSIMKTLQLEETKARELYKTAAPEFKTILEDAFGKDFFSQKITDRVKTFADACRELGINPNQIINNTLDTKDEIAYKKLKIIAKALNEDWTPNWNDSDQYKYFPCFEMAKTPGFGYSGSGYGFWLSFSFVSSRLHFNNSTHATYAGKTLEQDYYDYMVI